MDKMYKIILVVLFLLAIVVGLIVMNQRNKTVTAKSFTGMGPFRLKVSDPEYTSMLTGKKTVEARPDIPPFNKLAVDEPVIVIRARPLGDTSDYPGGEYKYNADIVRITKYDSIEKLLNKEKVDKVYPGKTEAQAIKRFEEFLPKVKPMSDSVIAIEIVKQKKQKN